LTNARAKQKDDQDEKLGLKEKEKEKEKEQKAKEKQKQEEIEKANKLKSKAQEQQSDPEKAKKAKTDEAKEKEKEQEKSMDAKAKEKAEKDEMAKAVAQRIKDGNLPPTDTSGFYDLVGVVTHKGRMADSGHYVGWTREGRPDPEIGSKDTDKWSMFDDDVVSPVTGAQILELCGGGDWHMAYLCFYRRADDVVGKPWATSTTSTTTTSTTSTSTTTKMDTS